MRPAAGPPAAVRDRLDRPPVRVLEEETDRDAVVPLPRLDALVLEPPADLGTLVLADSHRRVSVAPARLVAEHFEHEPD